MSPRTAGGTEACRRRDEQRRAGQADRADADSRHSRGACAVSARLLRRAASRQAWAGGVPERRAIRPSTCCESWCCGWTPCAVDCLELAVPFPNSPSDGPVIRESADRALADGVDRDAVFAFVESVRPQLTHLKIALLADWSYSIKDLPVREFVERVHGAGADGLLVHGMPPRLRPAYYETAADVGQPIVTTCYSSSQPAVIEEAADNGSAYIYLVSAYGQERDRRAARSQRAGARPADPARAHRHTDRRRLRRQDERRHRGARSGRVRTRRSSAARASPASPTRSPTGATSSRTSRLCSSSWGRRPS